MYGGGSAPNFLSVRPKFCEKFDPKLKKFPSIFEKNSFDKKFQSQGLEAKKNKKNFVTLLAKLGGGVNPNVTNVTLFFEGFP